MLVDKIEQDFKAAMKARDVVTVETIRMLKTAINNLLIEKKKSVLEETEVIGLIQKQIKARMDSIEAFKKGGRQDLVDKETREKSILESYLPAGLSDEELNALVRKVIQQTGAKSKADLGKVMKETLAQAGGRADGRRVNQIASAILTG